MMNTNDNQQAPIGSDTDLNNPKPGSEEEAVAKRVLKLIHDAFVQRASDIHFDPTEDGRGKIRYRIDGVLQDVEPVPEGMFGPVVVRLKLMSALNTSEKRLPQDGRIELVVKGKRLDLRMSTVPTIFGERIVIRILDRAGVDIRLDDFRMLDEDLTRLKQLCHLPNGVVICTGPTGSGKTTLLYGMLMEVDREKCCVMSVEDPVEYALPGVAQIPVRGAIGLTFPRAVRSMLRQDPDVIMIGEIRDLETVHMSVQCALTGHLLMTTLHTNSAVGAVKRLLDMGLEPFLLNASLSGIVAQRLVRVLCPKCKEPCEPPLSKLPPEGLEILGATKKAEFHKPKGCDHCKGMGYRGRTAVHEILIPDDQFRKLVTDNVNLRALQEAACQSGMKTLLRNGLEKAVRGITSVEEVLRVVPRSPMA